MRNFIPFILLLALLSFCSFDLHRDSALPPDGKDLYLTYCKSCHGKKGNLGIGGAAKLNKSELTLEERIDIIKNGKGKMTPYGSILSKKEVKAIAEFTMSFTNG